MAAPAAEQSFIAAKRQTVPDPEPSPHSLISRRSPLIEADVQRSGVPTRANRGQALGLLTNYLTQENPNNERGSADPGAHVHEGTRHKRPAGDLTGHGHACLETPCGRDNQGRREDAGESAASPVTGQRWCTR